MSIKMHKLPLKTRKVLYWIMMPFVLVWMCIAAGVYFFGKLISKIGDGMTGFRLSKQDWDF